jgi:predicted Zn-dependent peptidase
LSLTVVTASLFASAHASAQQAQGPSAPRVEPPNPALQALVSQLSATGVAAAPVAVVPPPSGADVHAPTGANAPVTVQPLSIERFTLPNGLEVIVHEDHRAPTVSVNIWYHVGSKDEFRGRNGFAHLFEHLMFQGSRHVAEDQFFRVLERAGATGINGTTGDDRTNYFETVPSARLGTALWLESDRMAFLLDHVNQTTLDSQRQVVLNEYRQNYENAPYGSLWRVLHEAVFPQAHPYHRLAIGTPEDLNAATLDDVRRFFLTWYVPNNATLVLAGDVTPAAAREMVTQYFGPIARGQDVPRRPPPGPVSLEREQRIEVEAGVELPRVYIAWPTPRYFADGDGELDLVGNVLTHGASSRLHRRLVRDLQIATDVSAFQNSMELGSMFIIIATGQPGQRPEALLQVIDQELRELQNSPPDDPEFVRAQTDLTTSLLFSNESIASRADRLNLYRQHVGDPSYLTRDVARYTVARPADVSRVARGYLPLNRRVVVFVRPSEGAPIAGRVRGTHRPRPVAPNATAGGAR